MENWEQQTLLELSGSVEQIIFRNDKNGYTVLELSVEGELVTAVGCSSATKGVPRRRNTR